MRAPLIVALALMAAACADTAPPPVAHHPPTAHNSRNSLDWAGTYRGVLPCADCQGIETVVVLRMDGRYAACSRYLGRGNGEVTARKGRFAWNEAGSAITLEDGSKYQVGEGRLFRLAIDGSRVSSANADHYILDMKAAAPGQLACPN